MPSWNVKVIVLTYCQFFANTIAAEKPHKVNGHVTEGISHEISPVEVIGRLPVAPNGSRNIDSNSVGIPKHSSHPTFGINPVLDLKIVSKSGLVC